MSSATSRFEVLGDLYYERYHRLRPGKHDVFRDSNDDENRTQFDLFMATHAFTDALDKIDSLQEQVEKLKFDLEEANDYL